MSKAAVPVYQIKITLEDIKPPIWRRVLISGDTTLSRLHDIIQAVMGWQNSHLHAFEIGEEHYSAPSPYDPGHLKEMGMKSTRGVKLNGLIKTEGEVFRYEYDFGDDWQHEIVLEKILPADPGQKLPVCIDGKRACPPEDIGGVWGYEGILEALQNPQNPEYAIYEVDDSFDPEAFDMDDVNEKLKRM